MRTLSAFLNDVRIGTLSEGNDLWSFEYDAKWATTPDSFDLSPSLQRTQLVHQDGGSDGPVQWYFDNLLPEESLREAVSKEANIRGDDAFALLEYLGAESAGSLVLLPPDRDFPERGSLQALSDDDLCKRIRNLPRATLSSGAPKPDAPTFGAVTRESVLRAGEALGLPRRICERELDRLTRALPSAFGELEATITTQNAQYPDSVRPFLGSEIRLIHTIRHRVIPDMIARVARS
jgi:HipA-like protein